MVLMSIFDGLEKPPKADLDEIDEELDSPEEKKILRYPLSRIAAVIGFCLFFVALIFGIIVETFPNVPLINYRIGGIFTSVAFLAWGLALSFQSQGLPPKAIFMGIIGLGCFLLTYFFPEWFYWFFIIIYIIMIIANFFD